MQGPVLWTSSAEKSGVGEGFIESPWTPANEPVRALVSGLPWPERGRRWVLVLQAAVDDSGGRKRDRFFALAGFVAAGEEWARFADAWRRVLDGPPRLEYFKMSEADSSIKQFANWPQPEIARRVNALADVIRHHVRYRIHCAITHRDYEAIMRGRMFPAIDTPYFFCFYGIINATLAIAQQLREPIETVFDQQQQVGTEVRRAWPIYKMLQGEDAAQWLGVEPIFRDDKTFLPLQAADLYVFHVRRYLKWREGIVVPKSAVTRTLEGIPSLGRVITADYLRAMQERIEASGLPNSVLEELQRQKSEAEDEEG